MIITLTKPIQAHGRTLTELHIPDEPTMDNLWDAPEVRVAEDGVIVLPRYGQVLEWAAKVIGVPPSSLRQLTGGDGKRLYQALLPLFLPALADGSASPPPSSSAQA